MRPYYLLLYKTNEGQVFHFEPSYKRKNLLLQLEMQRKQLKRAISDSYNKTLFNVAATPPPLSFPKSFIAFSKSKLDVCLRLVLAMDDQKVIRWSVSLSCWWVMGFLMSIINLSIWGVVGGLWWKVLGYW